MSDTTRKVDYFHVVVPDRPGECAKVLSALAAEGINLLVRASPWAGCRFRVRSLPFSETAPDRSARLPRRLSPGC